jgi:hypothetical protein
MNEGTRRGGLLDLLLLGAAAVIVLLLMVSAGGDETNTTTANDNQINLFSDVQNCNGAGSCTTNAPVNVQGDNNAVGVLRLCVDRDGNGYQTNQPCGLGYTAVQP